MEIVGNEAWVKSGAAIDFETNPIMNLNIQVTDNGTPVSPTPRQSLQQYWMSPRPLDITAPTISSIAVQGNTVILNFSEPVSAICIPTTAFLVPTVSSANVVTTSTITALTLNQNDTRQVILNLSGTAPATNVNLRVSYTDPTSNQTIAVVQAAAGNDLASFSNHFADTFITASTTTLANQYQNLILTGISNRNGTGNALANIITGNSAINVMTGAGGIDSMNGGEGSDLYLIASSADHTAAEIQDIGTTGTDELRFASITANQTLTVFAGDTGLEQVTIGTGTAFDDTLTGGVGADIFRFASALNATTNVDRITDFMPTAVATSSDRIQLENTGADLFAAITATGTLAATAFVSGTAFVTGAQRIRYDSTTGSLFYDPDGNGAQTSVLFATLSTGLAINNTHFQVT